MVDPESQRSAAHRIESQRAECAGVADLVDAGDLLQYPQQLNFRCYRQSSEARKVEKSADHLRRALRCAPGVHELQLRTREKTSAKPFRRVQRQILATAGHPVHSSRHHKCARRKASMNVEVVVWIPKHNGDVNFKERLPD